MNSSAKILSPEDVDHWVDTQRQHGKRIGFTCGSFDLLHAGHVQYLEAARQACESLLVAVNSDFSIGRYKSPLRPINPERERMSVLAGLASVDCLTLLEEDRPIALLKRWQPDLYIKGGDYASESLRSADAVKAYGGSVLIIQTDFPTSTTSIVERIQNASVHAKAMELSPKPKRGLVLLDRDGTLIKDVPFLHDPLKVEMMPGVLEGLRSLQDAGFDLAIVTNQQGIGLGYFTIQQFFAVNQRLLKELSQAGVRISKIYFCPHSMADDCRCRKPKGGLVHQALAESPCNAEQCFLVGDQETDAQAARETGCEAILIGETSQGGDTHREKDFAAAVRKILSKFLMKGTSEVASALSARG